MKPEQKAKMLTSAISLIHQRTSSKINCLIIAAALLIPTASFFRELVLIASPHQHEISATTMTTGKPLLQIGINDELGFAYRAFRHGMGHQILYFFAYAIYFEKHENRTQMILDESNYHYRLNEGIGLFTGFFTPKFPVIDNSSQYPLIQPFIGEGVNYTDFANHQGQWCKNFGSKSNPLKLTCQPDNWIAVRNLRDDKEWFYNKMVEKMCPSMQFNEMARKMIARKKREHGILDDFIGLLGGGANKNSTSVAFHVRRTDKIAQKESIKFKGQEYASFLVTKIIARNNVTIDHCFVATDDSVAVDEILTALKTYQVSCQVHSFATNGTVSKTNTIQFLSELSIMVDATYFVGTMNSNVGTMVGILRACQRDTATAYDNHFADTYGIDKPWFFN